MTEEIRVKYLFINLRYRTYVRLQVAIVVGWALLAVATYIAWHSSTSALWGNLWIVCVIAAIAEGVESKLAIAKAKASVAQGG